MRDEIPTEDLERGDALGLARTSLVFGIISVPLAFLLIPGVIAVVSGYKARRKIRASPGSGKGATMSLVGMILGLVSFLGGTAMVFAAPIASLDKARIVTAGNVCHAMESAVNNFYLEYGRMPDVGRQVTTGSEAGKKFLQILSGEEYGSREIQNTRLIRFIAVYEEARARNGMIYNSKGLLERVDDPYGHPYTIFLDADGDGRLEYEALGKITRLEGRRVAVVSPGRDGKLGTSDDIKTW